MPRAFLSLLLAAGLGLGCAQLAPCFEPSALASEPCTDDVVCVHAGTPATVVVGGVRWRGIQLSGGGSELVLRTSSVLGITDTECRDQFFCSKSNNPCLNNGTCHSRGHRVVCICPPAYIGERCEQPNPCSNTTVVVRGLVTASKRPGVGGGCVSVRQCLESEIVVQEATLSTDRACEPHPDGCGRGTRVAPPSSNTSQSIFDISCVICPVGKVQAVDPFHGTACSAPALCPAGEFAQMPPTATSQAVCVPCPPKTFSNAPSLNSSCLNWTDTYESWEKHCTNLGENFKVVNATSSNNFDCSNCPSNEFFETTPGAAGLNTCKPRTGCPAGQGRKQLLPSADGTCENCSLGTYQDEANNKGSCKSVTKCSDKGSGFSETKPPTPTSDRVCSGSEAEKSSASVQDIALGTVGGVIGLVASVMGIYVPVRHWLRKKVLKKSSTRTSAAPGGMFPNPVYATLGEPSVPDHDQPAAPKEGWAPDSSYLEVDEAIFT